MGTKEPAAHAHNECTPSGNTCCALLLREERAEPVGRNLLATAGSLATQRVGASASCFGERTT